MKIEIDITKDEIKFSHCVVVLGKAQDRTTSNGITLCKKILLAADKAKAAKKGRKER